MSPWRYALALVTVLLALVPAGPARAMRITVFGDQLVLCGPVRSGDFDKIARALADNAGVTTIILRNSPGGDAPTGYQLGDLFRRRGLRTAVSGFCYSSCSRMFLGGTTRVFTDDFPPDRTEVGFHGHYRDGRLDADLVRRLDLKDWIIAHSDGKADPALVERWINIPLSGGLIHFFHPLLSGSPGASTFFCQGNETTRSVFACEVEPRTALDLGVITSLDVIRSNDQTILRAAYLTPRPDPSSFAAIDDVAKVPLSHPDREREYRRFLAARLPRAFAISPDGKHFAWRAGVSDAMPVALFRCVTISEQTCTLYAVDGDIVWPSGQP